MTDCGAALGLTRGAGCGTPLRMRYSVAGFCALCAAVGALYAAPAKPTPKAPAKPAAAAKAKPSGADYAAFVRAGRYPNTMNVFTDEALLKRGKSGGSKHIYICLSQQRARLYIDGRVALDWPVSTGKKGHSTPTGQFRVIQKDKAHVSASYGKAYNAKGRVVDGNATPASAAKLGAVFKGAAMPYFLRLTPKGVGMHTGPVVLGTPVSHGCIRCPNAVASRVFDLVSVGTPVTICQKRESPPPAPAGK